MSLSTLITNSLSVSPIVLSLSNKNRVLPDNGWGCWMWEVGVSRAGESNGGKLGTTLIEQTFLIFLK